MCSLRWCYIFQIVACGLKVKFLSRCKSEESLRIISTSPSYWRIRFIYRQYRQINVCERFLYSFKSKRQQSKSQHLLESEHCKKLVPKSVRHPAQFGFFCIITIDSMIITNEFYFIIKKQEEKRNKWLKKIRKEIPPLQERIKPMTIVVCLFTTEPNSVGFS